MHMLLFFMVKVKASFKSRPCRYGWRKSPRCESGRQASSPLCSASLRLAGAESSWTRGGLAALTAAQITSVNGDPAPAWMLDGLDVLSTQLACTLAVDGRVTVGVDLVV